VFQRITLKNYRTHTSSMIALGPVTLLVGNNNSGKTNFLRGIQHFSKLIRYARPRLPDRDQKDDVLAEGPSREEDGLKEWALFPHKHRLAKWDEPTRLDCVWKHELGSAEYRLELLPVAGADVGCRERIVLNSAQAFAQVQEQWGWPKLERDLNLQRKLAESTNLDGRLKELSDLFFDDAGRAFCFHLEPSYLRCEGPDLRDEADRASARDHAGLGEHGDGLQALLRRLRKTDEMTFNRILAALRSFDPSFQNIRYDSRKSKVVWQFALQEGVPGRLDEFDSDEVSDGLLKAAAVAYLTCVPSPPPLIMLEEIENGINPANIQEFMTWLWRSAGTDQACDKGYHTQFLLTSHSPTVLRQFAEHLGDVYTVHLDRKGFRSDVLNLRDSLDVFAKVGSLDEAEYDEDTDGERVLKRVPPYRLAELWFNGTIG